MFWTKVASALDISVSVSRGILAYRIGIVRLALEIISIIDNLKTENGRMVL